MKNRATLCPAPTPGPPGSRRWRRTEEFGLVIRALGFRSLNPPVEKTGGGKGNLAGPCQPGGSKQHAGELERGHGLLPAGTCAALLPHARLGRSSEKTKAHEAAFDASRLSQGCTVCVKNTEPGLAGAGPKSPRKLRRGHRTRPQGFRGRGRTGRPLPGVRGKL